MVQIESINLPVRTALRCAVFALGTTLIASVPIAQAATATTEKSVAQGGLPAKLEAAAVHSTATVTAIDQKTRKVTLKGANGESTTLTVGPEVSRLDEVKVGDVVEFDFLESIAVSVHKPDNMPQTPTGQQTVLVRNPSEKPSGKIVETQSLTATVKSIDTAARKAELIGPNGNTVKVNVAPDVNNLDSVKVGDKVVVTITQALALNVRKPDKK